MSTSKKPPVGRRGFLKGAAGGAAALVAATSQPAAAQQAADQAVAQNNIPLRNASAPVATAEKDPALNVEVLTADRPGSDFMVDVLKALGFEYIFANPGSSFRGLHESVVNYGGNKKPGVHHLLPRGILGRDGATATPRSKASPSACSRTAPSACSTRPWRSTTPTSTARRYSW